MPRTTRSSRNQNHANNSPPPEPNPIPEQNSTPEPEGSTSEEQSKEPENERRAETSTEREGDFAEVPTRYRERPSKWPVEVQEKKGYYYALECNEHKPKWYGAKKFKNYFKNKSNPNFSKPYLDQLEYKFKWYGTDKRGNAWPDTWEPAEHVYSQEKLTEMINYYWAKKYPSLRKMLKYDDADFEEPAKSKEKDKANESNDSNEEKSSEASTENKTTEASSEEKTSEASSEEKEIPAPRSKRSKRK